MRLYADDFRKTSERNAAVLKRAAVGPAPIAGLVSAG